MLLFVNCGFVLAQNPMSQSSSKPSENSDKEQLRSDETINIKSHQGHYVFNMPEKELLRGCQYTEGYSFPSLCTDEKGNVIFDLLKDDQKVLDKIIKKQGRRGKYNKIDKDGIWVRRKPGHSVPEESIDVTGLSPAEAERKAAFEAHGYDYFPPEPGVKDYVEDYFTLPQSDALVGCMYTIGYSFPDLCLDDNGKVIFDATKHDQKVLDKIIKQQGKQGKYNKMPNGGPIKFEGVDPPNN